MAEKEIEKVEEEDTWQPVLDCPSCASWKDVGAVITKESHRSDEADKWVEWVVGCGNCLATGSVEKTEAEAIDAWNRVAFNFFRATSKTHHGLRCYMCNGQMVMAEKEPATYLCEQENGLCGWLKRRSDSEKNLVFTPTWVVKDSGSTSPSFSLGPVEYSGHDEMWKRQLVHISGNQVNTYVYMVKSKLSFSIDQRHDTTVLPKEKKDDET